METANMAAPSIPWFLPLVKPNRGRKGGKKKKPPNQQQQPPRDG